MWYSTLPPWKKILIGEGGGASTPNFEPVNPYYWESGNFRSQSVECLSICHLLPKHVYHHQLIVAGSPMFSCRFTKQPPKHQLQITQRIKTDNKLFYILSVLPRDKSPPSETVNASYNQITGGSYSRHDKNVLQLFLPLMDRKGEFNWCSRNFPNGDYFTPFPHGEGWILWHPSLPTHEDLTV